MPVSNFGLNTLTRYPGFGYGWSNQDFSPPSLWSKRASASINYAGFFEIGDKIRIVARSVTGTLVRTRPDSVRFKIRKRIE